MKWTKGSVIVVAAIFAISFVFSTFSEHQKSKKVEKEAINACQQQKRDDCQFITLFHDKCFKENYKSRYRTKHFYRQSYEQCLRREIAAFKNAS